MYIEDIIREEKKKLRERLIEIYDNGNEDVKKVISLLVQTEYDYAIERDNFCRVAYKREVHHLEKYKEQNKELIEHCWMSRVGR